VTSFVFPKPLERGDLITVVAPAGPFDATHVWRGIGFLRERYRVRFDRSMFRRTGYLAGNDERRKAELLRALLDPESRAIFAARGGYGALRITPDLPWDELAKRPQWIIGFSDITALHVEAARVSIASLHAPHVNSLGSVYNPTPRRDFLEVVESPNRERCHELLTVVPGTGVGILAGGNLTLLAACATAGRLALPPSCVLFLEDVTERPFRVDRMLTSLIAGGHFGSVRAVILGDFTECGPGPDKVTVDQVLQERLSTLGVPIVRGMPSGHATLNVPLVLGSQAHLDARGARATLILCA
jgi:muramoyltetrapeptide carboxypeptidase